MRTLSRSIVVLACLLSLIGLSGCEQVEEAKKAAGKLVKQTVDKAMQAIKEVTGDADKPEGEGKKEDAESVEDEGKKEAAESAGEKTDKKSE